MRNSKLYSVLKEFDKYEQNRCRKYIQSPYFNRSEKIAELYEFFIGKVNEGEEGEEFTKESIWEVLHSGTEFNSDRWRKYCSDLLKLIEGYLIQEEFDKDTSSKDCYLMQAVNERELKTISSSIVKKSENNLKKYPFLNSDYYQYSYLVEKNKYQLIQFDKQRVAASNTDKIVRNLDVFYLSEKLRYYCNVLSRQSTVSHEYEIKFIEEIVNHVSSGTYDSYPAVIIYYQIYLALNNPTDEKHYYKLKDLLKEHAIMFPQSEASDMYSFVINYCTRQLNSGNRKYLREYFELHQQLLETKIIIIDNELSVGIFKNLVVASLQLGETAWTENFISEYKKYLPDSQRNNAVTFNSAQLYFHQKKYDEVIQLLQKVEYEDYIYNVNAKQLLLRTYFEIEALDPLFFLIDSFRAYLYRNPKISTKMKETYSNFLTITKKLSGTKKRDKKTLASLKEEIKEKKNLANRPWLLEKITELE
jgi:hypothetical protein